MSFEPSPVNMSIGDVSYPAVYMVFSNRTPSVVYLTNPQLTNCSALFPIPPDAARDIGANARPLSFVKPDGGFEGYQITLQTGDQAKTGIAVGAPMHATFYDYRASRLRRIFRRPKYFVLEYTAMVGEKKCSVATIH